ncbi:retrovirus-related Pol polyprotein from transposon 412 [Trichonephila clavipes]|nr:retrovirus-related Pol polyprotein from transposon 412 [Trichonephila clavipes]
MGHEGTLGHLCVTKTKNRIARYFYRPQWYKEIEEFVKTCDPCQRPVGPLTTTPTGNKYLLTFMCMPSKYPDAVPMPDIATTTVVGAMFQIFSRMGFPKGIFRRTRELHSRVF